MERGAARTAAAARAGRHMPHAFSPSADGACSPCCAEEESHDADSNKEAATNSGSKSNNNKEEKVASLYPPDWWWAERQVNEILSEHPGKSKSMTST